MRFSSDKKVNTKPKLKAGRRKNNNNNNNNNNNQGQSEIWRTISRSQQCAADIWISDRTIQNVNDLYKKSTRNLSHLVYQVMPTFFRKIINFTVSF